MSIANVQRIFDAAPIGNGEVACSKHLKLDQHKSNVQEIKMQGHRFLFVIFQYVFKRLDKSGLWVILLAPHVSHAQCLVCQYMARHPVHMLNTI